MMKTISQSAQIYPLSRPRLSLAKPVPSVPEDESASKPVAKVLPLRPAPRPISSRSAALAGLKANLAELEELQHRLQVVIGDLLADQQA